MLNIYNSIDYTVVGTDSQFSKQRQLLSDLRGAVYDNHMNHCSFSNLSSKQNMNFDTGTFDLSMQQGSHFFKRRTQNNIEHLHQSYPDFSRF